MKATFYVNTPLTAEEHAALQTLAKKEGRAKGRQLGALAVDRLRSLGLLKPATRRK